MSHPINQVTEAFAALSRARYLGHEASHELAFRRAEKAEGAARAVLLEAAPATAHGAWLHLLAAWRERCTGEELAAGWAGEARRITASMNSAAYARTEAMRFAGLDAAPAAARKIRGAARLLGRRRPGALLLLRQALKAVQAAPLPDTNNAAIERHLDLALQFLARPRAV